MRLNCPFHAGDYNKSTFLNAIECYQESCALWDYNLDQCCFKTLISNIKDISSIMRMENDRRS